MKDYIISLDIGTTSTKGILYRIGGDITDVESIDYPLYYPGTRMVEQDPQEVLMTVIKVVQSLLTNNRINPRSISALVFGGILHSMIPMDKSGNMINRALIWADSRSIKQSDMLRATLDVEEVKQRTGCTIHPMYFLPRLVYFRDETRALLKRTYKFVSIKEYILFHLYGNYFVDKSIASGTGIWNMATMEWDSELLGTVGIKEDKFSTVVETTFVLKGLKKEYAMKMGLMQGTPGIIGASDGPLAHLGSVGLSDTEISLTVGTGAALRRRMKKPTVLPGVSAWCYYMTENNWLLGGVIQDAGIVMKWFSDNFVDNSNFDLLNSYAQEISPGSDGLVFLPFLGGERCPHDNPDINGAILGLSFNHNKKHFTRALMEGISYRLYSVYEMLTYDGELDPVITGGILKSPVWLKIVADFFGKSLWISQIKESAAWGAVLICLRALGIVQTLDGIDKYVKRGTRIEPDMRNHRVYKKIYNSYTEIYDKLFGRS